MATSEPHDSDSTVIKNTLAGSDILYHEDRIEHAWFDDDGWAHARLVYEACVTEQQLDAVRDSGLWKLEGVHKHRGENGDVELRLVEIHD